GPDKSKKTQDPPSQHEDGAPAEPPVVSQQFTVERYAHDSQAIRAEWAERAASEGRPYKSKKTQDPPSQNEDGAPAEPPVVSQQFTVERYAHDCEAIRAEWAERTASEGRPYKSKKTQDPPSQNEDGAPGESKRKERVERPATTSALLSAGQCVFQALDFGAEVVGALGDGDVEEKEDAPADEVGVEDAVEIFHWASWANSSKKQIPQA